MALFHLNVKQVKRSQGQSAIASAAYRAGEKLSSEYYGEIADYTHKGGVICSEILLPDHVPREYADRETFWNAVEKVERGKNAQLAYSFDVALQNEFSMDENIALARQFLMEHFVSRGMIVDFAVHLPDKDDGGIENPHFHIMAPIRPIEENGKWGYKQRRVYELDEHGNRIPDGKGDYVFNAVPTTDWGSPETLEFWREQWANLCKTKSGRTSIFSGLVFCADCGEKLYYGATNNGKVEGAFFDCSLHWKRKDKCGTHFIRESVLNRMVLRHIQLVTGYILHHRQHFISVVGQKMRVESAEKIQISRKQLERNEKRITELKRLFIKIYEDNAKGKLSDERFDMMSQSYEAEQKQLEAEVITLREEIQVQKRQNENIERFIQTAHKYVGIEELDPYALRELVQAIYVDAPDKSSGKRRQNIHIKYDGIGVIPLNELMQKETA